MASQIPINGTPGYWNTLCADELGSEARTMQLIRERTSVAILTFLDLAKLSTTISAVRTSGSLSYFVDGISGDDFWFAKPQGRSPTRNSYLVKDDFLSSSLAAWATLLRLIVYRDAIREAMVEDEIGCHSRTYHTSATLITENLHIAATNPMGRGNILRKIVQEIAKLVKVPCTDEECLYKELCDFFGQGEGKPPEGVLEALRTELIKLMQNEAL
ncbi:hypothetical protein N657DRAFT_717572 [Parathielavia appendiculata]|uniref:Uncharacterized protein n=1 Tax=Parathielavia appendiculata TaxID=2587402 RepID=A0AAN6U2K1_9PEZI|nr:hypothetical protein N657DRAFT_717572 [Parathielavia appendiculata]